MSTTRVLAAALRGLEYDLVLAGADTSDGGAGVVPAGVRGAAAACRTSRTRRRSSRTRRPGRVRVRRISPTGYDVLEAPMPALVVCTQALGEPRYPSLKGIMAARSKEIDDARRWPTVDDAAPSAARVATTDGPRRRRRRRPRPRRGSSASRADEAAKQVVDFLVERRII